jgi:hypothetical protein
MLQRQQVLNYGVQTRASPSSAATSFRFAMDTTQPGQHKIFDPDRLLQTCSAINYQTKQPCTVSFGTRYWGKPCPKYLPTCASHRNQQLHAGVCQYQLPDGTLCCTLFKWTPPYFQFCASHYGCIDENAPCHFLKLPTELRQEIFKYLVPVRVIASEPTLQEYGYFGLLHTGFWRRPRKQPFTTPLLWLYVGFNREVYPEVRDVFYASTVFFLDVNRDGVMLCE